jgi:uncharacterized protein YegP (UPF0339 family)
MSGKITKSGSDEAVEGDLTDWDRVHTLTDEQIEEAIRNDPDTFALEEGEVPPFQGLTFRDPHGRWRWRLIGPNGQAIADSPRGYDDRSEVDRALRALREAIVAGSAKAA